MAILHVIRTSSFKDQQLALCIETLSDDDGIIFLDDGIYNLKHSLLNNAIEVCKTLYFIDDHAKARGISYTEINKTTKSQAIISPISMAKFIELTCNYKTSITWQ